MRRTTKVLILCLACILEGCDLTSQSANAKRSSDLPLEIIDGLSFVAPPQPFSTEAMSEVVQSGANWIAVIPYGFARLDEPEVYFNTNRQWWGERTAGVIETIKRAKTNNLKVMLKPQVYVPGSWPGNIDFHLASDWRAWENSYRTYILQMAQVADSLDVDLFCVGTELKISTIKRPAYWNNLIEEIKSKYDGPLTYAANWDEWEHITFWSSLDYIGIDAYYPLSNTTTPTVRELEQAWQKHKEKMDIFSRRLKRPYLFTEFGYMSVDKCADRTWELEKKRSDLNPNQQAQANAYEALFKVFWNEPSWRGGFVWKWYPYESNRSDYRERDYTPQGKIAAKTLYHYYTQTP